MESDVKYLEEAEQSSKVENDMNMLELPVEPPPIHIPRRKSRRKVKFCNVEIRNYGLTYSDNPYCHDGPPIGLDWCYTSEDPININVFEANRLKRRRLRDLLLNTYQRRDKLITIAGLSLKEIEQITREVSKARRQRAITRTFMVVSMIGEAFHLLSDRLLHFAEKDDNPQDLIGAPDRIETPKYLDALLEEKYTKSSFRRRRPRNSKDLLDISISMSTEFGSSSTADMPFNSENNERRYTSANSDFLRYDVMVDRTQSDKAMQIKLCSAKRPHMRAFHASWFSFFVAFFAWFAITPLLSEVQDTLGLTDREIWTSSLSGSASTIVFRILMGPACDKFGARLCMAAILLTSAIPTALTGFVQSSIGLSVVRAFIGIAGSSFVACQYWTSSMFAKEIAGTANALVAGWGNLGGGMAQILIGSVLFPFFKWIYKVDSSDTSLAWRTVFIIPAVLSFATGLFILFYCDDSPKGNIRKQTRQRELLEVSSITSLSTVLKSKTTWILFLQYAGCFGVEVTMTNGVAKYFKDEYLLSTEESAAIASTFGFMNIFARGLGGFASDNCNVKLGIHGRVIWQFIVLFIEGCAVLWFSFTRTMTMSILALICTSLCVQLSEGSTFGIVPYVNRRYTGGVVGFVAAGGNVGGVLFAFLFRQYGNRESFLYMGISAMIVSFLSFFLTIKKDAFFHNAEVIRVLLADPEDHVSLPISEVNPYRR